VEVWLHLHAAERMRCGGFADVGVLQSAHLR
jgi:hypothetical protein